MWLRWVVSEQRRHRGSNDGRVEGLHVGAEEPSKVTTKVTRGADATG